MGQGKRRFFTPDFKAQAVTLVTEGKHPISQIAADLGIGESLLRRWRRDHEEQTAPASNSQAAMENRNSMEEELRRLRRENERLRQERDILKRIFIRFRFTWPHSPAGLRPHVRPGPRSRSRADRNPL